MLYVYIGPTKMNLTFSLFVNWTQDGSSGAGDDVQVIMKAHWFGIL